MRKGGEIMKKLYPIIMSVMVMAGPTLANAQTAPTGVTEDTITNTAVDRSFDWRWLLPILAIPIVYALVKNNNNPDSGTNLTGTKGGQSEEEENNTL
jgi:hypothetical protein